MAQDDILVQFVEKLKREKTPEEMGKYIANLLKFGAAEVYFALTMFLTDEDKEAVEKIEDDEKAKEEIKNRFKLRTGLTIEEFIDRFQSMVANNYLSQQNAPKSDAK